MSGPLARFIRRAGSWGKLARAYAFTAIALVLLTVAASAIVHQVPVAAAVFAAGAACAIWAALNALRQHAHQGDHRCGRWATVEQTGRVHVQQCATCPNTRIKIR